MRLQYHHQRTLLKRFLLAMKGPVTYAVESRACHGIREGPGWWVETGVPGASGLSWDKQEHDESYTSVMFFFCFVSLRW